MTTPKRIAGLSIAEIEITQADFDALSVLAAAHQGLAWDSTTKGPLDASEKKLVTAFKKKLKTSLFTRFQGSFCCYCAIELSNHQAKYDLEHVIAKDGRSQVVFALENLALSCGPCNTIKSNKKSTTSPGPDSNAVPIGSVNYLLVHPHYDSWTDFFEIDQYRRVNPKYSGPNLKARNTIEICGIEKLNAIRLAQRFDWVTASAKRHRDWVTFYQDLYASMDPQRSKRLGKFVATLLASKGDPAAANLYALFKDRIDELLAAAP
ncbi:MAG: hypothetical protein IPG16_07965 [Comamonadaceae bacterium]|jgi:hypothetical protein|nr:hypothetical protein [Comamonadaceae bacterium]